MTPCSGEPTRATPKRAAPTRINLRSPLLIGIAFLARAHQVRNRINEHVLKLAIIRRQMAAECAVTLVRIAVKPDVLD